MKLSEFQKPYNDASRKEHDRIFRKNRERKSGPYPVEKMPEWVKKPRSPRKRK